MLKNTSPNIPLYLQIATLVNITAESLEHAQSQIEAATHYQMDSSQKLITAIKVASQVNEQLASGSISATETASQLKHVVNDLRNVVGQQE